MNNFERRLPRPLRESHWFHSSYFTDWALCFLLIAGTYSITLTASPFCRYDDFSVKQYDPLVAFPLNDDTIPPWTLIFFCLIIPIFLVFAFQRGSRTWHDFHCGSLATVTCVALCVVFTEFGKITAGRYRPDFLARLDKQGISRSLSLEKLCEISALDPILRNGRLSFPSGHTSFAFCGAVFMTCYLSGRCRIFSSGLGHMYQVILCLVPLFVAFMVGISRTRDYRHNFSDVVAGAIIGIFSGIFGYRLYYPSLGDLDCGIPRNRAEAHAGTILLTRHRNNLSQRFSPEPGTPAESYSLFDTLS